MSNVTIYTYDASNIFTGAEMFDPLGPVPPGALIAPPSLTPPQVAQWQGESWAVLAVRPPAPVVPLSQFKTAALIKIDADADNIYGDVVGNKGEEYRSAEADAKAFIAANYTGTAGGGVTSWADAKSWTYTQAANDIMTQATAWRGAQAAIRANRLARKEAVKVAVDLAALSTVMGQWNGFVVYMRGQLGV